MVKLSQQETKSLVALHGWSAVLLGLLLYAVVATGAVAVLAEEIRHWSIGAVKHENPLLTDVDSIVRDLSGSVEPEFLEEVGMGASPRGNLELFFHTHRDKPNGEIEEYGVEFEVDPQTHAVLSKRQGTGLELHRTRDASALSRFLVDIHTELHLPSPWGLLLTGVLGLAMMVAAVSGFLMHRHLFTDMFVLRRERSDMVKRRDVHTVAGTWGLPFAFILAFTGSFFSFAGSFGLPAMAMVAFGGDQEAMIRTIIGVPETESERYLESANINRILADGYQYSGNHAEFAAITHFGRDDAKVLLFMPPEEAKLDRIQLEYDGVSGEFVRQKPGIGIAPSLGSMVLSLMEPLHFGNFAGLLSRFVWVALGFAACYVILSGFTLWLQRRSENDKWLLLERFTVVFGTGLPLAMLVSAAGYFLSRSVGANANFIVPASFFGTAIACILAALVIRNGQWLKIGLLSLCAALCLAMPAIRMSTGGLFWDSALAHYNPSVVMIDWLLIISGLLSLMQLRKALRAVNGLEGNAGNQAQPVAALK